MVDWDNPTKEKVEVEKVDPLDPTPIVKRISAEFNEQLDAMMFKAQEITVVDASTCERANDMLGQAKKIKGTLEKERKIAKGPFLKVCQAIDGLAGPIKIRVDQLVEMVSKKVQPYLEQKAEEEAARAAAEREEQDRIAAKLAEADGDTRTGEDPGPDYMPPPAYSPPPAPTRVETAAGTSTLKPVFEFEIVDFKQLPDKMLAVRAPQLRSALGPYINAQIKVGVTEIPGVRIYQVNKVSTRAR